MLSNVIGDVDFHNLMIDEVDGYFKITSPKLIIDTRKRISVWQSNCSKQLDGQYVSDLNEFWTESIGHIFLQSEWWRSSFNSHILRYNFCNISLSRSFQSFDSQHLFDV